MFQANAMGIFGLISVAMCWAFAVILYRVGASGAWTQSIRPDAHRSCESE